MEIRGNLLIVKSSLAIFVRNIVSLRKLDDDKIRVIINGMHDVDVAFTSGCERDSVFNEVVKEFSGVL